MNDPASQAHIFQINASNGDVPKQPLREAEVNCLGLSTDSHHDTVHHGGPERALCLYSLELISGCNAKDTPSFPAPRAKTSRLWASTGHW